MKSRSERPHRCHRFTIALAFLFAAALPLLPAQETRFRRGDANGDGTRDISDTIAILRTLFLSGEEATCAKASDSNDDGEIDISDGIHSLSYLFLGGPAPPAPGGSCGTDPTPDGLSCRSYAHCTVILGQSDFVSRSPAPPGGVGAPGREGDAEAGVPAPPAADQGAPAGQERAIEESDIYKVSGKNLFVLNRYRGLQILDLNDLDHPRLVGQATIFGYPREMYVRDTNAYVIVSDYYSFWRGVGAEDSIAPSGFHGSQLRIIDISDVKNPRVVGGIDIEGDASDSRIVGDTMYLVSQRYPWYYGYDTEDREDKTVVLSVDVSDPANVKVVDQEDFPRNGWEHHLSVTPSAIYLASSGWDARDGSGYQTRIRYVDISDPAGDIRVRGEATVAGRVQDRWSMDEYQGALRVASGQSWGNGDVFLTTFSVADPDGLKELGKYTLHVNEQLTSARFDGSRGYLVSYERIDPLFAFDLSDPAKPVLLDELKMTGWLDFMVPMGDRLVALGHEDLTAPDGKRTISLAVSLIDVAQSPKLLSRVTLDGVWGWVPATRDDFAKVFRTLPEERLIVFPFQAWSQTDWRYVGGVQLIDLDRDRLTLRGLIKDAGWVERGVPYDPATVLTISSEVFQVMDIADRDAPRLRGRLELARNVQDFAVLPGGSSVQLAGDWYRGSFELLTTSLDDPNAPEPLGRLPLGAPYGRMFVNGTMAYVVSVQEVKTTDGSPQQATVVQVVDVSDPAKPVKRGSVALPETIWPGYGYWNWGWGDEVAQVNGSTLAFHRFQYYWWRCLNCDVAAAGQEDTSQKIYLVDLKDPDAPAVASTVSLSEEDAWAWGLRAIDTTLYLSSYRTRQGGDGSWETRYYLQRIGAADPANPILHPPVNIPGYFVGASADNQIIYSQESFWTTTPSTTFYALALIDDQAYLQSKVDLPGYPNGFEIAGEGAFATNYRYETVVVGEAAQWRGRSTLFAIDLRDPQSLRLAGKADVPFDYAYLQKVSGGRAFLGSGAGIFTYQVSDLENLVFENFFRTQGWTQDITVSGGHAYVTSGYYGVQVLDLEANPSP